MRTTPTTKAKYKSFLPFAGFVNLNNDYAGKTIALQYVINVVTGNGVALLSCDGVVFQVEETEPSSEIIYLSPSTQVKTVGGDDWNEMLYYGLEPYIYCKWYESASNGRNTEPTNGHFRRFQRFIKLDNVSTISTPDMLIMEQEMIYSELENGVISNKKGGCLNPLFFNSMQLLTACFSFLETLEMFH